MLSSAGSIVVSVVILGYIVWNQIRVRRVRTAMVLPVILIVLGAGDLSRYVGRHGLSAADMAVLAVSFLFVAIGLGAVRAYTVRLWQDGGNVLRQGTYVTILLWLAGAAIHVGVDSLVHSAAATYLLYLGLTLGSQRLVLAARAKRLLPWGQ